MAKVQYTPLNLPKSLVEELKIWKMAYEASYGRSVSYAEIISGMIDSLEDSEPGVVAEMDRIIQRHPELTDLIGKHRTENED